MNKKYFREVMFQDETIAELSRDGLIYRFKLTERVIEMLKHYPCDRLGWFFNSTRDRYCAEIDGDYVMINPAIVNEKLGMPVLY